MNMKYNNRKKMDAPSMKKIKGGGIDAPASSRWRCLRANGWSFQICHIGNPILDDCAADAVSCVLYGPQNCTVNACA